MAIFGSKKKTASQAGAPSAEKATKPAAKARTPKKVKTESPVVVAQGVSRHASAILRPRITEKSGLLSQGGVYTFEIATGANKNSVAHAVRALYKVAPVKVAIVNAPAKNVFVRGRKGVVPGVRKALVTLKKGDKIDFV